jgi:hypothetical protein
MFNKLAAPSGAAFTEIMKTTLKYYDTGYQLAVFPEGKTKNYIATCEVKEYFDTAAVSAMLGRDLFMSIYRNRFDLYAEKGTRYLIGYVFENIAETIKRMSSTKDVKCTLGREYIHTDGQKMIWIEVDLQNQPE